MSRKTVKTPSLHELQSWMMQILQSPGGAAEAKATARKRVEQWIAPSPTLTAAQRLDIYSGMYQFRLQEVLFKDFPCVAYAMGEHAWYHITRDYVAAHPSRNQNLNLFNARFPEYLYQRKDLKYSRFLGDLARLEWAMVEVVHARTSHKPDLEPLRTLEPQRWEAVRFQPSPSLRLLEFNYPVNDYLQSFREEKHPRIPRPKNSYIAVNRVRYTVWRFTLSRAMFVMLQSLVAGQTLRTAIRATQRARAISSRALETAVFKWFQNWVADDFFEVIAPPASRARISNAPLIIKDSPGRAIRGERVRMTRYASEAALKSTSEAALDK